MIFRGVMLILLSPLLIIGSIGNWLWRAIFGHEDKSRNINLNINLNVTMLGAAKTGKTTLLACMLRELMSMSKKLSGFQAGFQVTDYDRLNELYNMLVKLNVLPTENAERESISIKYKNAAFKVSFYDFPGDWLNSDFESSNISSFMKDSSVIIIPVEMPLLIEENGKYKDVLKISELEYLIRNDLLANNSGKLIILAPVMCEKYRNSQLIAEKVTSAYKGIIKDVELYASKLGLAGNLAVAMIPVKILGNAEFEKFSVNPEDGLIESVYSRASNLPVESQNADQLIKLALLFLLREMLRQDDAVNDSSAKLTCRADINKLIDQLRDTANFYSSNGDSLFIDILFGREIFTGA